MTCSLLINYQRCVKIECLQSDLLCYLAVVCGNKPSRVVYVTPDHIVGEV